MLTYFTGGIKNIPVRDSATIVNGHFQFTGEITDTVPVTLRFSYDTSPSKIISQTVFYLVGGTTFVNGSVDSVYRASITGNKYNTDDQEYTKYMKPIHHQQNELDMMYYHASPEMKKSKVFQNNYHRKDDSLTRIEHQYHVAYIDSHPDSYASIRVLHYLYGFNPDYAEAQAKFNHLSLRVRSTKEGIAYQKFLNSVKNAIKIGDIAPDFAEADTNGNIVKLSTYRGKYVLVDFWASWCGPCREENPNLIRAYNNFKGKKFTILSISSDQAGKKNDWLKAIHADHLTWTQLCNLGVGDDAAAKLYGVRGIPANFLIDPDGKVIAKNLRGGDLDSVLTQIFSGK